MTATTKKLTASIEGEFLVIRVPMNPKPTPSSTGKTLVVASSHGNKETEVEIQGKSVYLLRHLSCSLQLSAHGN